MQVKVDCFNAGLSTGDVTKLAKRLQPISVTTCCRTTAACMSQSLERGSQNRIILSQMHSTAKHSATEMLPPFKLIYTLMVNAKVKGGHF